MKVGTARGFVTTDYQSLELRPNGASRALSAKTTRTRKGIESLSTGRWTLRQTAHLNEGLAGICRQGRTYRFRLSGSGPRRAKVRVSGYASTWICKRCDA